MTDLRKAAEMALDALFEAQDEIREWGGYASDYFQKKHDLLGSIAKLQPVINTLRTALEHPEPDWTTDTPVPPFKYLDFAEYKGTGESVKIKHTLAQGEQDHGFDRTASHTAGEYVDASDTSSTCVDENEKREHEGCAECGKKASDGWALYCVKCTELFAQPEQEPFGYVIGMGGDKYSFSTKPPSGGVFGTLTRVYTAPPSKPWVSLTDEEIGLLSTNNTFSGMHPDYLRECFRAIEAKLKELNHV